MISPVAKITDHNARARARLVQQFKDKPKIEGFLDAFVTQSQDLENATYDVLTKRNVFDAEGVQLDLVGTIVNEPRKGRDDDAYRIAILTRIGINVSRGTPENLIVVFKQLTSVDRAHYYEYYPAETAIFAGAIFSIGFDIEALYLTLQKVLPAGVRLNYIGEFLDGDAFSFAGDPDGLGFSSILNPTIGGKYARLLLPDFKFSFASNNPKTRGFGSFRDRLAGGGYVSAF